MRFLLSLVILFSALPSAFAAELRDGPVVLPGWWEEPGLTPLGVPNLKAQVVVTHLNPQYPSCDLLRKRMVYREVRRGEVDALIGKAQARSRSMNRQERADLITVMSRYQLSAPEEREKLVRLDFEWRGGPVEPWQALTIRAPGLLWQTPNGQLPEGPIRVERILEGVLPVTRVSLMLSEVDACFLPNILELTEFDQLGGLAKQVFSAKW